MLQRKEHADGETEVVTFEPDGGEGPIEAYVATGRNEAAWLQPYRDGSGGEVSPPAYHDPTMELCGGAL